MCNAVLGLDCTISYDNYVYNTCFWNVAIPNKVQLLF